MLTIDRRRQATATRELAYSVGPLRVLVVDDHPAVRAGLRQLLEEQPDLVVVNAVASAEAAMAVAEHEPVDVVVADYQLTGRSGLWLSRMLKRLLPAPRVLVYSAYCDGPLAAACVVAEADGLVSKAGVGADLCHAVREVGTGATRLPVVPPRLADAMRRRLEPQDQAIYGLLLAGISRTEVAETLRIAQAELDARMWTMLRTLEGLEPAAGRG
jgi:DNA-binding NarL/FixJ family response regulator